MIALDLAKCEERRRRPRPRPTACAKKYEQKHGLTLLKPTPFYDSDTFTMLTKTAHKLGVKTIADMKGKSFSYAGLSGVRQADHVHARLQEDLRA